MSNANELSLKPCPLCKKEIDVQKYSGNERDGYEKTVLFICKPCGLTLKQRDDTAENGFPVDGSAIIKATKLWNTRPEEERLRQENERLREAGNNLHTAAMRILCNENHSYGDWQNFEDAITSYGNVRKEALNDTE